MGQVPKNFPFTSIHVFLCITLSYIEVENLVSIANYKFQTSCVPGILIYIKCKIKIPSDIKKIQAQVFNSFIFSKLQYTLILRMIPQMKYSFIRISHIFVQFCQKSLSINNHSFIWK